MSSNVFKSAKDYIQDKFIINMESYAITNQGLKLRLLLFCLFLEDLNYKYTTLVCRLSLSLFNLVIILI